MQINHIAMTAYLHQEGQFGNENELNHATFYRSAYTKPGSERSYICALRVSIFPRCFYAFCIRCWNCTDCVVFFVLHFILYILIVKKIYMMRFHVVFIIYLLYNQTLHDILQNWFLS